VLSIAQFFEVSADGLMTTPFRDLLMAELSDPDRFDRVEAKIEHERRKRGSVLARRSKPPDPKG
jgi:hypothetical protein